MNTRQPRSTLTATPFPDATLFRSNPPDARNAGNPGMPLVADAGAGAGPAPDYRRARRHGGAGAAGEGGDDQPRPRRAHRPGERRAGLDHGASQLFAEGDRKSTRLNSSH